MNAHEIDYHLDRLFLAAKDCFCDSDRAGSRLGAIASVQPAR